MSEPPSLTNLPAFLPDLPTLASLTTTIQQCLAKYALSTKPLEKATLLQRIQHCSTKITRLATPLPQQFMELQFRANLNVAVRIALEMNLLESLPLDKGPLSCSSIAAKTNSDVEFVLRIARVLGAYDILVESYDEGEGEKGGEIQYSHTSFSILLMSTSAKACSKHAFDNMLQAQTLSAGSYYKKYGFNSPVDSKNCAFSYAHEKDNMGLFDILEEDPERMLVFNEAMRIFGTFGLKDLTSWYPWTELKANEDGVVLVDVGGGKGHVIKELREGVETFRGKGKLVLQDLGVVLEGGVVDLDPEIILMPYNFLTEIQPIKGANYFFKSIFHDWPDATCLQILKNLAPAMKPTISNPSPKLLITELVLADHSPAPAVVLRDMNMLCIGGKERSLSSWKTLISQCGYKIVNVHGSPALNVGCVIESVLA